jgi:hypothetical protein
LLKIHRMDCVWYKMGKACCISGRNRETAKF